MFGKKRLVIVELRGRLGNQLFMFAAGYALAKKFNAELAFHSYLIPAEDLLLPKLIGHNYREVTNNELLKVGRFDFRLLPHATSQNSVSNVTPQKLFGRVTNVIAQKLVGKVRRWQKRKPATFKEKNAFQMDTDILEVDFPVYLKGYFQNEGYFIDHGQEIVGAINLLSKTTKPDLNLQQPIIGISFRRGDYNALNVTLPIQYYDKALFYLMEKVNSGTLLLFGDDYDFLELMKDRWSNHHKVLNALNFGSDPVSQLFLLAECQHCIISNSSFAWWGALLGDHKQLDPDRVVIAPGNWLGEDSNHCIPDRWIKVSSERLPISI